MARCISTHSASDLPVGSGSNQVADIAAIRWWEMTRAKRSAEARVEHQVAAKIVTAQAPDWRALIDEDVVPTLHECLQVRERCGRIW